MSLELLRQYFRIFITRHLASTFSSYDRVVTGSDSHKEKVLQQETMVNTYHRTRSLYDCYKQSLGIRGIILVTDDIIANPHLLIKLSNTIGLDPSKLKVNWAAKHSPEEIATKKTHDPKHLEFM
jgi:hypothetical protein